MTRLVTDDALRQRLGATGRERAQGFDWPMLAGQCLNLYAGMQK